MYRDKGVKLHAFYNLMLDAGDAGGQLQASRAFMVTERDLVSTRERSRS